MRAGTSDPAAQTAAAPAAPAPDSDAAGDRATDGGAGVAPAEASGASGAQAPGRGAHGGGSGDEANASDPPDLETLARRSLLRTADADTLRLALHLAARPGAEAVLFYGNRLRDPQAPGLADLYVLTSGDRAWHGRGPVAAVSALANRLLPPNVYHVTVPGIPVAAKVAVLRRDAFHARMRRDSRDTTLWARFAQPAALLWSRDGAAEGAVVAAVATGWRTAAWWADRLAEPGGDRWAALFTATYGAELRVEAGAGRAEIIARAEPDFYASLDRALPREVPTAAERALARRDWGSRQRTGRLMNAARLVKAAFTFRGGLAYARSKIERHAGPEALRPWERRAPWLAAPVVLLRLLLRRR